MFRDRAMKISGMKYFILLLLLTAIVFSFVDGSCPAGTFQCSARVKCSVPGFANPMTKVGFGIASQYPGVQSQCQERLQCVSSAVVCDDENDCADGSDEFDCTSRKGCNKNKAFSCYTMDNECIPRLYVCDGQKFGCTNNFDETNCDPPCADDQSECKGDGDPYCIPDAFVCDGGNDCSDGADEKNCTGKKGCNGNIAFSCASGNECVPRADLCDGTNDCSDGSDETVCSPLP